MFKTSSLAIFLTLLSISCGAKEQSRSVVSRQQMVAIPSTGATVASIGGDAPEVRIGSAWLELEGSLDQVSEVRAGPRGSIISTADATLWLRSGSKLRLGTDDDGALMLEVVAGQARVKTEHAHTKLLQGKKLLALVESDVLLSHQGDRTVVAQTRLRPQNAIWSLELEQAAEPRGIGKLEVGSGDQSAALELRALTVDVSISSGMAVTSVEHIFFNSSDEQQEGTFRFPAPDGVMVTGLAMEIDGRLMEGEFVERIKARQVYEEIVDEMQDPALLEWQEGGWFGLRVFPIEAQSEKRVVLRYTAPLTPSVEGYEYRYLATPPQDSQVGAFSLRVDNKVVAKVTGMDRARDVVLHFPKTTVPKVVSEQQADASFRALTFSPNWDTQGSTAKQGPRNFVIALDSSRSALENRQLSIDLIEMLLAELTSEDRFALFAHDIGVHEATAGLVPASADNIEAALRFSEELEFDGASDLAATLQHAGTIAAATNAQVIYIGDGTPTWGQTKTADLLEVAKGLGSAPLFAAVVGRGASSELWSELTASQSGTVLRPQTRSDAKRHAFFLASASTMPRLEQVKVVEVEGLEIFPRKPRTLFYGETMTVLVRAQGPMPTGLQLRGRMDGAEFAETLDLDDGPWGKHVGRRWARHEISRLQPDPANKPTIVELSRKFGVLSKHTSLLVLESEEAYRQHQIERKKKEERLLAVNTNAPQVSGGDLDSLDARQASLSPDHIQPGDPEVRIPAPADARSVVIIFPFGDTKLAHYDEEAQTWIARFLVDTDTKDGEYWVRVTIEHADGHFEEMRLPYTVDTKAPKVKLRVIDQGGNRYRLVVEQQGRLLDAMRVEVYAPWGQTVQLYQKRPGFFHRTLHAPETLGSTAQLRVVVTDEALNQQVLSVEAPIVSR